ncbi:relaxase [Herbaspirillum huttiense]|uniref:relaxase/mobilization nuclease domain-containing protein n=1 Tax=Herbaspirillum huttiense TaxID=863372 RepID=UPI00106576D4|nr:relaxase/mobilization nuclease domain-containing protein [Herbaspirillum huttiense]QBP73868.1 relaxase [Herbaspirillum huttiense]
MIVRIFRSGISSGESPVNYLLGDVDPAGQSRSVAPEVLAGDPQTTIDVINSIQRKHKYISGCLSFRDSEKPSREKLLEVIDDFKATFCPGLTSNHFNSLFVLHQDKGNTEVHFVIPTQELTSGRRMNIHPPGKANLEFFEAYTRVTNHRMGYAQIVPNPLKMAFSDFERKTPLGRREQSDKRWVHRNLVKAVVEGTIQNRDDLCRYLDEEFGITVTRQGDDYLSVKFPGGQKAKRLRGPLYSSDADYQSLLEQSEIAKQPKYLTKKEFESEKTCLSQFIQERRQFNEQTYLAARKIRRLVRSHASLKPVNPAANTTITTRSPAMKNTIHLPVIKSMILRALAIAREEVHVPFQPVRIVQPKTRKATMHNINALREKAFGQTSPEIQTGLADLMMAIAEVEVSLGETISKLSDAETPEKAEKLRQRIIHLQLELDKLNAQKVMLPVQGLNDELNQIWRKKSG